MKTHSERLPIITLYAERAMYEIDPPYQREGGVWSLEKKQLFLDSIFNGFDIPKIYLRLISTNTRGAPAKYAIVDGKQRLTTIWEFLNSDFALDKDFSWEDRSDLNVSGKLFRELPADAQMRIQSRAMDIVMIETDDDEDMPSFKGKLTDEEIDAAAKYVKGL